MKKILVSVWLFLSFQTILFGQADNSVLQNAISKIQSAITDHIIEKAYLHFDRPYASYLTGEIVYFKAYVTMGERHEPTNISSILHADLIDKNDMLVKSINIQLTSGVGYGDFSLPDTLQKGSYRIRAYTQWMRNGEHPYFFDQYISVSSPNNVDRIAETAKQTQQPELQFFPEGGNLMADVQSKVAFKAIGTNGLGINVKGIVVDNENKEVARIAATHLGMGTFDLTPETGKTYKAKLTYGDGSQSTVNLPLIEAKGITLAVNTSDPNKISIEIKANRPYYKENLNKDLNLLIYWGGSVRTVKTKLDNAILGLDLPANIFRTGIMQLTLFSQTGEPLNERLAFIQNPDLLNLSLITNKTAYTKRENVSVNLNAKNKDGNPVNGSFSVSVIDESKILVDENAETTILSNMLLTSDVKGYVEKPGYYFANVTKESRADLDVLMLTQGYRRLVWKQLLNNTQSAIAAAYKPEHAIDITGKIKTKAGVPIPGLQLTLLPSSGGGAVKTAETDGNGNFRFADMLFNTGDNFILKTNSSKVKNAVVIFDKPSPGPVIGNDDAIAARYNSSADILASLQNSQTSGVMTASNASSRIFLKNDKVVGPKRPESYRSSNLGGPGNADQVISGDVIKNAPSLSAGLNGLARGIDFIDGVGYLKTSQVVQLNASSSTPMLLVVDGVQSRGSVDVISPTLVETVEILKDNNAIIYGVEGGAGVIVITTRQGQANAEPEGKEMSPGVYSFSPVGYYKAREFYSPRYDAAKVATTLPDNRTTIFWKPDIITDANGNSSFSFYNADGAGTYRMVIEGIDNKGNLGRQVYTYKVQ